MSFSNSIWRHVKRIHTYAQAERFFDDRKALRSKKWDADTQRPLYEAKNASQMHHYRIERHQAGDGTFYYDLVLYETPMVRYFKPKDDGTYDVWVRGHSSKSSWDWLSNHGWGGYRTSINDTFGVRRLVFFNPSGVEQKKTFGDHWSAKLRFNEDNRLIVEQSRHVPIFIRRSSDEDKRNRAALKRRVSLIVELAAMRRDAFADEVRVNSYRGKPFTGTEVSYDQRRVLMDHKDELLADIDAPLPEAVADAIMDVARGCYERLVNVEVREAGGHWRPAITSSSVEQAHAAITDDKLQASVVRWLMDYLIGKGSARLPLPQFPPEDHPIPRTTFAYPDEEFDYADYFNNYPPYPAR